MEYHAWHEDVSEKGFFYKHGNVQGTEGVDGMGDPIEGNFDGSDTYSLFGKNVAQSKATRDFKNGAEVKYIELLGTTRQVYGRILCGNDTTTPKNPQNRDNQQLRFKYGL